SIIKAIILGIVQGITEFLPISSSGHLSLFQHWLGVGGDTSLLFSVLLHMGTLAAVFIVYYETIWDLVLEFIAMVKDIVHGKFKYKQIKGNRRMLVMFFFSCLPLLLLLIPIGDGQTVMDFFKRFSEDTSILAEGFCFLFTAVLLLAGARTAQIRKNGRKVNTIDAVFIGIAQAVAALLPGVSRSGSTISTGLMCGISKDYMVKYSFILGIPAILAANVMELKDAVEAGEKFDFLPAFIGIVIAAVVGVLCIKLLQVLLKKDMFKYFGYYCLALGGITIIIGLIEKFAGVYIGIQ
ncbi:MAG: undecaprenyl-diphosphate phosphatase, partial [Clostridiales bacterium]|nr:undecaprenyl-diphosphate phosphatase [Clostridiales bacterium]